LGQDVVLVTGDSGIEPLKAQEALGGRRSACRCFE
jgi:hypothetical protein